MFYVARLRKFHLELLNTISQFILQPKIGFDFILLPLIPDLLNYLRKILKQR